MVCCWPSPSQHCVSNGGVFCVPPPEEKAFEVLNDGAASFKVCFGERIEKCTLTEQDAARLREAFAPDSSVPRIQMSMRSRRCPLVLFLPRKSYTGDQRPPFCPNNDTRMDKYAVTPPLPGLPAQTKPSDRKHLGAEGHLRSGGDLVVSRWAPREHVGPVEAHASPCQEVSSESPEEALELGPQGRCPQSSSEIQARVLLLQEGCPHRPQGAEALQVCTLFSFSKPLGTPCCLFFLPDVWKAGNAPLSSGVSHK